MPDDQKLVAGRRRPEESLDDLPVRPAHADAEHVDQHPAAVGDVLDARLRDLAEMERAGFAGDDGDRTHLEIIPLPVG